MQGGRIAPDLFCQECARSVPLALPPSPFFRKKLKTQVLTGEGFVRS